MLPLTWIVFFLTFLQSFAFLCLTPKTGNLLEYDLDLYETKAVIDDIRQLDLDLQSNGELCRIYFYINFEENDLIVEFSNGRTQSVIEDGQVQFDVSVIVHAIDIIRIIHEMEYACSDDQCDFHFVFDYLGWFIESAQIEKINELLPYISGDKHEEQGYCLQNDQMSEECPTNHCVIKMNEDDNGELISETYCGYGNDIKPLRLTLSMVFSLDSSDVRWKYEFRCEYNDCNNETIVKDAIATFHQRYDMSAIINAFVKEETSMTSVPSTSTTQETTSTTTTVTIASTSTTSSTKSSMNTTTANNKTTTTTPNHALSYESSKTNLGMGLIIIAFHFLFLF